MSPAARHAGAGLSLRGSINGWSCWRLPLALIGLAVSACAGPMIVERPVSADLAWPVDGPRIRLESILEAPQDRSLGGRLGGTGAGGPFSRPQGIAWDGEDLLVTDPGSGYVIRIVAGGDTELSPRDAVQEPIGIAVCPVGLLVTDARQGKVALLDGELRRVRWFAEGLERPTGIACNDTGVYVVETGAHRVRVIREENTAQWGRRGAGRAEFNFPTAIAVAGDSLWVGDTLNFRVQRLDAVSGAYLGEFGQLGAASGNLPRMKDVAVDRDGHLWVSDGYLNQVGVFQQNGAFLMDLGRQGSEPGEFSVPQGIAARGDGRIAVVDSLNRRIQIFRLEDAGLAELGRSRNSPMARRQRRRTP